VFVDDLPRNVAGARAFGMVGIDLDLLRPRVAFERARVALGLP
jgi:FMN phosphatase YigB (HAD superfamily)